MVTPIRQLLRILVLICVPLAVASCGGKKTTAPDPKPSVTVTPGSPTVNAGATLQFTATVTDLAPGVTWSLAKASGNTDSLGTITQTGLYTAPMAVTKWWDYEIRVTATSTADGSVSGSTVATVPVDLKSFTYQVINTYPHADTAWTQGFEYDNGMFLEGTGRTRQSYLWRSEIASGNITQQHKLGDTYFGEGVTRLGDKIYQVTWTSTTCFVYNQSDFSPADTLSYTGQGWGLTNNGTEIIMSNGSSLIRFRNPMTFDINRDFRVYDRDRFVDDLNELEYIDGMIYSNVWQTDSIAVIDPADGRVAGWIDLTGLPLPQDVTGSENVLNGIAYDAMGDRLFVTGKLWSVVYEIELVPPSP
jgi:glutamine cyclotransferase